MKKQIDQNLQTLDGSSEIPITKFAFAQFNTCVAITYVLLWMFKIL